MANGTSSRVDTSWRPPFGGKSGHLSSAEIDGAVISGGRISVLFQLAHLDDTD